MSVRYRTYLQVHQDFRFDGGLFYQNGFYGDPSFIKSYLELRQNEGRLYTDKLVLTLPEIPSSLSASMEWMIRKRSTDRLIKKLETRMLAKIAEIGSGNGWLVNYMSKALPFDFCGIDINDVELKQAARLFGGNEKMSFVCGDIFSQSFTGFSADVFVLAGAIQYFSDPKALLQRLLSLLRPKGEIHILDSPFYNEKDLGAAARRGRKHFEKIGHSIMQNYYFYHSWESIQPVQYELLYDPSSIVEKLKRFVITDSPFPWIRITKI